MSVEVVQLQGCRSVLPLFQAAIDGDAEGIAHLITQKADVAATDEDGNTAVHFASDDGHSEVS